MSRLIVYDPPAKAVADAYIPKQQVKAVGGYYLYIAVFAVTPKSNLVLAKVGNDPVILAQAKRIPHANLRERWKFILLVIGLKNKRKCFVVRVLKYRYGHRR